MLNWFINEINGWRHYLLFCRSFGWLAFSIRKDSWPPWGKKWPGHTKVGLWTRSSVKIWSQGGENNELIGQNGNSDFSDSPRKTFTILRPREFTFTVRNELWPAVTSNIKSNLSCDQVWPICLFFAGLFLEGASLDRKSGKLVESRPKVLYEQMPVIYIYAINTTAGKQTNKEVNKSSILHFFSLMLLIFFYNFRLRSNKASFESIFDSINRLIDSFIQPTIYTLPDLLAVNGRACIRFTQGLRHWRDLWLTKCCFSAGN